MKDTFILYASYADQIALLDREQRGDLLTAIMAYANEQETPELDPVTKMAWSFIESDLNRNAEKYAEISEKRREAGRISGEARRAKSTQAEQNEQTNEQRTSVHSVQQNEHYDNDNEPDPDNEPVCANAHRTRAKTPTLEEVKAYCNERGNKVDPEAFMDYYTSQKWKKANGRPVEDWKACVRTWERRDKERARAKPNQFTNFEQRKYDADFERRLYAANSGGQSNQKAQVL